ncbi:MAG: glycosyltransferase family 1 protein, partial [Desulfovibrionaceae bacterium]|nr:glycosyltransferase family 1 protein [Desulfovibrionaceae bacterium]
MRTIIAIPPLARMSGGVAVLYQLADRLHELGKEVVFTGVDTAPGLRERAAAGDRVIPWQCLADADGDSALCAHDLFLIPEGWPNMAAPPLRIGARLLVYVQNWAFLFSGLPAGISWENLPASFLAVSHPVAYFMTNVAQLPLCGIVRPVCDAS